MRILTLKSTRRFSSPHQSPTDPPPDHYWQLNTKFSFFFFFFLSTGGIPVISDQTNPPGWKSPPQGFQHVTGESRILDLAPKEETTGLAELTPGGESLATLHNKKHIYKITTRILFLKNANSNSMYIIRNCRIIIL